MFLVLLFQLGCNTQLNPVVLNHHLQCSQACEKLYGRDGDCQFTSPGDPEGEASAEVCMEHCLEAMSRVNSCDPSRGFGYAIARPVSRIANAGEEDCTREVGDYEPNEKTPSSESVRLENRAQAKLWMECLEEKSCELIKSTGGRFCAPVW